MAVVVHGNEIYYYVGEKQKNPAERDVMWRAQQQLQYESFRRSLLDVSLVMCKPCTLSRDHNNGNFVIPCVPHTIASPINYCPLYEQETWLFSLYKSIEMT
ncbi:predicted protein [Lichtheimia corymbifera JMRC:FSU:9682]|uniref:Uncharacterized protein n=1 Tax=Lichtheimia corymbifera JMRC:FSU:9682 TaxID=1263082 RepID=A0A068SA05_9FUNG|nr:predicted protein [Lichtheimia corymbifera JMRC:FSU:9682]